MVSLLLLIISALLFRNVVYQNLALIHLEFFLAPEKIDLQGIDVPHDAKISDLVMKQPPDTPLWYGQRTTRGTSRS